jgi:hypothetical protein
MRHSLRLDRELSNFVKNSEADQNYWKNEFNYNTPLANDKNIYPPIEGVSMENRATSRILLSIQGFKKA